MQGTQQLPLGTRARCLVRSLRFASRAVMLATGSGNFAPFVPYTSENYASGIAIGDLNGDGKLDLAVAANGGVDVLPGDGLGGFGPPTSGNRAFDEYRAETLRRLEDEEKEFREFLNNLRFAKDKAEFDDFLANRRSPAPPETDAPIQN